MFKNAYQSGLLSIFYSCGAKPLELWDVEVKNGHIKRLTDNEVRSIVLEIGGSNVSTTYITCPKNPKTLGITLPYMVMIVKSLNKHFTFEVTVLDQTGTRRRFRVSNFQSKTQILPLCTTMPITLNDGWNQIQFNLAEFTKRSYKMQFIEVSKLRINANIRLRRVYFTETLLPDDQLPPNYRLYIPLASKNAIKAKADKVKGKENIKPSPLKQTVADDRKISKVEVDKQDSKLHTIMKPSVNQILPEGVIDIKTDTKDVTKSNAPPAEKEGSAPTEPVTGVDVESTASKDDKPSEPPQALETILEEETAALVETVSTEPQQPLGTTPVETIAATEEPPEPLETSPVETIAAAEEPAATTKTDE